MLKTKNFGLHGEVGAGPKFAWSETTVYSDRPSIPKPPISDAFVTTEFFLKHLNDLTFIDVSNQQTKYCLHN